MRAFNGHSRSGRRVFDIAAAERARRFLKLLVAHARDLATERQGGTILFLSLPEVAVKERGMNDVSNGLHRSPADIVFFVLCFIGLLITAAGIITNAAWAAAFGIFAMAVSLAYFAICEFL
jgi:hypothetical protein